MTIALTLWVGAYFALTLAMLMGVLRLPRSQRLADDDCGPVTVLVSARNEERDLPRCLMSLAALDYPAEKLQIVLVNDLSVDATGEQMEQFARSRPGVVVVHTAREPSNGLDAKARGIAHGFTRATGEWVLITDADAAVPPQWVRHLLGRVTPDVGLVGGSLVVEATGLVGRLERVSWAFTQSFALGAAGWGIPFICVGPNMGIRRSVYVAAGGLEANERRVAEDLSLFLMAAKARMRGQVYMDADTAATLIPVPSLGHLLSQQRRWLAGGMQAGGVYLLGLALTFGWGFGVAVFLAFGFLVSPLGWGGVLLGRLVVDGVALRVQQHRLRLRTHLQYLVVNELYTTFIFLFLPISLLLKRRFSWRGVGYAEHFAVLMLLGAVHRATAL